MSGSVVDGVSLTVANFSSIASHGHAPSNPPNIIEGSHLRVAEDYDMIKKELFSACYVINSDCQGFCSNYIMRRISISSALDTTSVRGKAGRDLFGEFDIAGEMVPPKIKKERIITLSEDIQRPVITYHAVTCRSM
jgi:hypothetical protein